MRSQTVAVYIHGSLVERKVLKEQTFRELQEQEECVQRIVWFEESVDSRRQFQKLRRSLMDFDVLVIRSFQSLTKTLPQCLETLLALHKHDVRLVVLDSKVDVKWDTDAGSLLSLVCAGMSQLDDSRASSQQKGFEKARQKGVIGAPSVLNDDARDMALSLRSQGLSLRKIATQVGVSYGTVQSLLKAETAASSLPSNEIVETQLES